MEKSMKSIKPGRGPSFMGGVSSIFAAIFGVIWTFSASAMGAPGFFSLFGVVFVIMAIGSSIYNFKNATSKNRFSTYDITDSNEEPDPLNMRFHSSEEPFSSYEAFGESTNHKFCPYCGAKVQEDFEFCNQCGKKLP